MRPDQADTSNKMTVSTLTIRTKRLELMALSADQLRLYLTDPVQLEAALNLNTSLAPAGQALRRAIGLKLAAMAEADEETLAWHTYWLVVVAADRAGAGFAGFKGAPDETGLVEIGYGIEPAHRGQGYATEATAGLVEWAFSFPACQAVTARTLPDNEPSAAVLRKLGFRRCGMEDGELLWRREKERA